MRKENPLPQFKVASYKCLGIRLSFEDPTTLLPGGGGRGEGRIGRLRSLEEMPPKFALFSTVLSKIVAFSLVSFPFCFCLQVVQHLKHRTSLVTCSLRRSSLQQQQQHSCTRIEVSPVYMTPAPRREGPENSEDRDN